MRRVAFYLSFAFALLSTAITLHSVTLLRNPELWPGADEWVGLERGTLDLTGAPNERIEFRLEGVSLGGRWASPNGLSLTLEEPQSGLRVTLPLLASRTRDWGDTLFQSSASDDRVSIPVSFQVPSAASLVHRRLIGRLGGIVEVPRRSGEAVTRFGMGPRPGFTTEAIRLSQPIYVNVVAPEESSRSHWTHRIQTRFACGLAGLFAFGGWALYLRIRKKRA